MTIRTTRVTKRVIAAVATAALGATLLALPTSPASATPTVSVYRTEGADRYLTSNALAFKNAAGATNEAIFVLASGESFADGLAASSMAGALNATLMLTPQASLPDSVITMMRSLSSTAVSPTVVIVGGEAAVSAKVAETLKAIGFTVNRVQGADRYATANAAAAQTKLSNTNIGLFAGKRTAFLTSGTGFADAVSASGFAFENKHPIFLTNGTTLSAETAAAMVAAGVQQVIILGGTAVVSDAVKASVEAVSGVINSLRIGGADRYETATLFATAIGAVDPTFLQTILLVDGKSFPDALAASQLASVKNASIIPVTDPLPAVVSQFIAANKGTIQSIETVGGLNAVPASVVTAAKNAATIAQPTAAIAATDGSAVVNVTFTAPLNAAAATTTTSYSRTTPAGVTTNPTVTYAYSVTTGVSKATLTFAGAVAPGDTIRVIGNVISHATVPGLTVATALTAVVADVSVPSAEIVAYKGTVGGEKVWVTFSPNTDTASFACADLVHQPAAILGAVATFNTPTRVAASQTFTCDIATNAVAAGDAVVLPKNKINSSATTPISNAAVSATASNDITPPLLESVTYSTSAVGGVSAVQTINSPANGGIDILARAGTAVAGKAGNSWKLAVTVDGGASSVTVTSATKTVTVNVAVADQAFAVTNLLNGNAAFSALFIANVSTSDAMTGQVVEAAHAFTGGTDKMTTVATFSEPLKTALAANFTSSVTGALAIKAAATTNNGLLTRVITLEQQTGATIVSGVATLTVDINITDRNGVAVVVNAAATNVVAMTAS